jgi:hypothetical protein
MKITLVDGQVTAIPENEKDLIFLLGLKNKKESYITIPGTKKYKIKKECPECKKICANNRGLGIHRRFIHGVITPRSINIPKNHDDQMPSV